MEWSSMEPFGAAFILGDFEGDTYVPADDCDDVLEELLDNLIKDNPTTGTFRRRIGLEKVLEKDLIPLMRSTKDEKIFGLAVRLLANLTQPQEGVSAQPDGDSLLTEARNLCTDVNFFKSFGDTLRLFLKKTLLADEDRQCLNHCVLLLRNLLHMRHGTANDEHIVIAHQCLLSSFFVNELDKIIITMLQHIDKECWAIGIAQLISFIFKEYSGSLLEPDLDDDTSNSSGEENQNMVEIVLTEGAPNNTHHPRHPTSTNVSTTKTLTNTFKRNLKICSTTGGGSACSLPMEDDDFMLEIKSTQDGRLEMKLTNPSSVNGSGGSGGGGGGGSGGCGCGAGGVGSRGSRGSRGSSEDVTGMGAVGGAKALTGEMNGPCDSQTHNINCSMKCPRSSSTLTKSRSSGSGGGGASGGGSGSGSRTSPTNPLSSSNQDMEKDVMSTINSSSLLMDMDIFIAYLKKFATDIVYSGLLDLVENMMKALLTKYESIMDHSLLMWTIGFFLSFLQQQELDLLQVKEILNLDLFGFLVYEGVKTCEAFIVKRQRQEDCASEKHRLHLVVCTLNQMFRTLLANNKAKPASKYLQSLQMYLSGMSDLRNLFVLLIRLHSSAEQGQMYLCDLVQTNHVLMMMMEEWMATGTLHEGKEFSMLAHVNQFATCKVMAKYGSLLEQEDGSRETLNIAVLTMMYHVAGSCQRHDTLVQLPILKAFTEIWMDNVVREENKIRNAAKGNQGQATVSLFENEFKDLIEFVLKMFMNNANKSNGVYAERLFANAGSPASHETSSMESMNTDSGLFSKDFGEEEHALIMSWMAELSGKENAANIITRRLRDHGFDQSVEQVKKYLEDNGFMVMHRPAPAGSPNPSDDAAQGDELAPSPDSNDKMTEVLEELSMVSEEEMIPYLVGKVKEDGNGEHLVWLQTQLMEAAYVKLGLQDPSIRTSVEQPVARFYALQNKSIPMVPWYEEVEEALATPHFLFLQKCLGLYTNDDPSIIYPRIPQYLTPSLLVDMASRVGPIESLPVKFDVTTLKEEPVTLGSGGGGGSGGDGQTPDSTVVDRPSKPLTEYQWLNAIQAMNQAAACSSAC